MSEAAAAPSRRRIQRGTAPPPPPHGEERAEAPSEPTVVSRVEVRAALDSVFPDEPGSSRSEVSASPHEKEGSGEPESFPWENKGRWGKVVNDLYSINVEATYVKLRRALSLGDDATEYGVVLRAVDLAEQYAFEAGQLARLAKLEQERVDLECDKELEVLRTQAREELEEERSKQPEEKPDQVEEHATEQEPPAPRRGKKAAAKPTRRPPTIQDLEDRMLASWPKRVKSLKMRKSEAHAVRATMDHLAEKWMSRCATLRMMGEKVAPHR